MPGESADGLLDAPGLDHASADGDQYVLDLLDPALMEDGAVTVLIPSYPERDSGDRITVYFRRGNEDEVAYPFPSEIRRYLYLADPGDDPPSKKYPVRFQPLHALLPDTYEVSYMVTSRTNNTSLSKTREVSIVNAPLLPASSGQIELCGVYRQGLLDVHIVPNTGTLSFPDGVLLHTLGTSTASTQLGIYWAQANQAEQHIASLECDADGTTWSCKANPPVLQKLARGDLLSIKLENDQEATIHLAISL